MILQCPLTVLLNILYELQQVTKKTEFWLTNPNYWQPIEHQAYCKADNRNPYRSETSKIMFSHCGLLW